MKLEGKTAIVTGANGGLGRRITLALAAAGCDLALVCRSSVDECEAIAQSCREKGVGASIHTADLSAADACEALAVKVLGAHGGADLLVNNAALNRWVPFTDLEAMTPELWDEILSINASGPFYLSRALAEPLAAGEGGRIVNVSSIGGLEPKSSSIAYSTSKAALIHLTRCLAVAMAPDVLVNCVAPGYMEETRMSGNLPPERVSQSISSAVLGRPTSRDDVADQVLTFARGDSTTGQTLCIDAGRHFH